MTTMLGDALSELRLAARALAKRPGDAGPMTFATVACVLVAVSALATLPARRAAGIDPLNALRSQG